MTDEQIRRLEREAELGDGRATLRWVEALDRAGLRPEALRALTGHRDRPDVSAEIRRRAGPITYWFLAEMQPLVPMLRAAPRPTWTVPFDSAGLEVMVGNDFGIVSLANDVERDPLRRGRSRRWRLAIRDAWSGELRNEFEVESDRVEPIAVEDVLLVRTYDWPGRGLVNRLSARDLGTGEVLWEGRGPYRALLHALEDPRRPPPADLQRSRAGDRLFPFEADAFRWVAEEGGRTSVFRSGTWRPMEPTWRSHRPTPGCALSTRLAVVEELDSESFSPGATSTFVVVNETGEVARVLPGHRLAAARVGADGFYAFRFEPGVATRVHAFDRSAQPLWECEISAGFAAALSHQIVVATGDALVCYRDARCLTTSRADTPP